MAYAPLTWVEGQTKLGPTNMNHIEQGIALAGDGVASQMFVDATGGSDANDGSSWGYAKATIAAAISALPTEGGTVWVAAGTYTKFTISSSSTTGRIEVRGIGKVFINFTGASDIGCDITGYPVVGVLLENLHFQGNGAGSTQTGIRLNGAGRVTMRRLRISDCLIGLQYRNDASAFCERNHLEDTLINNCGAGIDFTRTATGHQSFSYNTMRNVGVDAIAASGVAINFGGSGAAVPAFYGCDFKQVVAWSQNNSNVLFRLAGDMKGVQAHFTAEYQAGSSVTAYDVTTNCSNMDEAVMQLGIIGAPATSFAVVGSPARNISRRMDDDIRIVGQGLKGQTFDREGGVQGATILTNQQLQATAVALHKGDIVTNLAAITSIAGAGQTLVKMGLYDKSGNFLKATADVKATFAGAAGAITVALTSVYVVQTDDIYYIAIVGNGGTQPTLVRGVNLAANAVKFGSGQYPAWQVASQTDMSGNLTPAATGVAFWFGWS